MRHLVREDRVQCYGRYIGLFWDVK